MGVQCSGEPLPGVAVATAAPEPVTTGSISLESAPPVWASAQALEAPAPAALADLDSKGLAKLIAVDNPRPAPSTRSTKRTRPTDWYRNEAGPPQLNRAPRPLSCCALALDFGQHGLDCGRLDAELWKARVVE